MAGMSDYYDGLAQGIYSANRNLTQDQLKNYILSLSQDRNFSSYIGSNGYSLNPQNGEKPVDNDALKGLSRQYLHGVATGKLENYNNLSYDPFQYSQLENTAYLDYYRKYNKSPTENLSDYNNYYNVNYAYKGRYDNTTQADRDAQNSYSPTYGNAPFKYWLNDEIYKEQKDLKARWDALYNDPNTTQQDYANAFRKEKWMSSLTDEAQAYSKPASQAATPYGAAQNDANPGKTPFAGLDMDMLKQMGFDPQRGFQGILDGLTIGLNTVPTPGGNQQYQYATSPDVKAAVNAYNFAKDDNFTNFLKNSNSMTQDQYNAAVAKFTPEERAYLTQAARDIGQQRAEQNEWNQLDSWEKVAAMKEADRQSALAALRQKNPGVDAILKQSDLAKSIMNRPEVKQALFNKNRSEVSSDPTNLKFAATPDGKTVVSQKVKGANYIITPSDDPSWYGWVDYKLIGSDGKQIGNTQHAQTADDATAIIKQYAPAYAAGKPVDESINAHYLASHGRSGGFLYNLVSGNAKDISASDVLGTLASPMQMFNIPTTVYTEALNAAYGKPMYYGKNQYGMATAGDVNRNAVVLAGGKPEDALLYSAEEWLDKIPAIGGIASGILDGLFNPASLIGGAEIKALAGMEEGAATLRTIENAAGKMVQEYALKNNLKSFETRALKDIVEESLGKLAKKDISRIGKEEIANAVEGAMKKAADTATEVAAKSTPEALKTAETAAQDAAKFKDASFTEALSGEKKINPDEAKGTLSETATAATQDTAKLKDASFTKALAGEKTIDTGAVASQDTFSQSLLKDNKPSPESLQNAVAGDNVGNTLRSRPAEPAQIPAVQATPFETGLKQGMGGELETPIKGQDTVGFGEGEREDWKGLEYNNRRSLTDPSAIQSSKSFVDVPFDKDGKLLPNVRYRTGEFDYFYETDSLGKIGKFSTDNLQLTTRSERLAHDPNTPGKLPGDQAGHLAGDRFGGSGKLDNLVTQLKDVNIRQYKNIENQWAKAIREGKQVKVQVDVKYEVGSLRPSRFDIKYEINGIPYKTTVRN